MARVEGRDAVFFARCGFKVDALEISLPGIEKIKQHSIASGCPVNTVHANMIGYEPSKNYAVIYSMGALQFLPPQLRAQHFERYKQHTSPGGLNAHMVFVEKPFIPVAPDWDKNVSTARGTWPDIIIIGKYSYAGKPL